VDASLPKPLPGRAPVVSEGAVPVDTAAAVATEADVPGVATSATRRGSIGDCCEVEWYERKAAGPDDVRVARRRSSEAMVVVDPTLTLAARRP
jgi:hypothetical protein